MFVCAPDNVACLVQRLPETLGQIGVMAGLCVLLAVGLAALVATAAE